MVVFRRVLMIMAMLATVVVAGPPLAAEALYRYALHELGQPPTLRPRSSSSPLAATAFWLDAGERLPLAVEPMSAWRAGWAIVLDRVAMSKQRKGERVASLAARAWLADRPRPAGMAKWHLTLWAATVWASRHWDASAMTRVWMEGAWYGRGAHGLGAASLAYFDKQPNDLAPHELALLVALTRSPSSLSPDCQPERATGARAHVLGQLLSAGAISRSDHDLAVAQGLGAIPRHCE
jgi:hypothetical protein